MTGSDTEGRWEPDIDIITADDVFHDGDSTRSRVDFEIAFFTVILTVVFAYPSNTRVYSGMKALLVLFALLTVLRRIVVMTDYRADCATFMTYSKEFMVEISALAVVYIVVVFSEVVHSLLGVGSFLAVFGATCFFVGIIPAVLVAMYARDDFRLDKIVIASHWANRSPIRYWRRVQRNRAIKQAQKIHRPNDELPAEIVALREKTVRRTFPFPAEMAQLLHGFILRLGRWSMGAIFGWAIFRELVVSLVLLLSILLIGSQIHRLYRRYGLEGYSQRPSPKRRRLIQAFTIVVAHPLLLFW